MKAKIGLVQFPVEEARNEADFFMKCESYFAEAKAQSLDMLVFPELTCLDLVDFNAPLEKQWQYLSTDFAEKYFDYIRENSKWVKFAILAGSTPVLVDGKTVNRTILFERGQEIAVQDKVYMTPEEELVWNWTSTAKLNVFEWRGIKSTILICHDSEFADISNLLSSNDVELFIVPSMTSDVWGLNRVRWCSKARAIEHHSYVLITGTVDSKKDQNSYVGQAALVTPQNPYFPPEIALGPFNSAALVSFEIDIELLRKSRGERNLVNPRRDLQARKDGLFIFKK
jgi:predicted amidohydrolase